MSRWESHEQIYSEFSPTTGELMLSASDVLAYVRYLAAIQPHGCHRTAFTVLADTMRDNTLEATLPLVDGSES